MVARRVCAQIWCSILKLLKRLLKMCMNQLHLTQKQCQMKVSLIYQKKIRHQQEFKMVTVLSPPTKTLMVKEIFEHLKQFLSIMEKCDLNAERSLQV